MYTRSPARFAVALAACAAVSLLTLSSAAHAQTFITTNTTLDASNPTTAGAVVGYASINDLNNKTNPTSPTVNLVSGGFVDSNLNVYNSSLVNVSGGIVDSNLVARNNSIVNVSGGLVRGDLYAENSSIVNLSGGSVHGSLFAFNNSIVNVSGGNVGDIFASDSSTFNLFGTGLIAPLVNPNFFGYSQYSVSGTLSDGTFLVNKELDVQNGSNARFTLNNTVVPEPGSVALLVGLTTVGASLLRKRRACK